LRYVSHPLIYPGTVEDRLYQRRIAEVAKDKNTLVVLPTALGKTVISALVAADILYNYRESRILVMAPTRPLVLQHRETFRRLIRLPEEDFPILTGKAPAEYRMGVWNGPARLVFATPEVVRNDILQRGLKLNGFGLVVVDECHRAVKEYAYTEVCSAYLKDAPYPLILGMTASPGSDIERVEAVCRALSIEHIEYRSDWDPDVRPYINPIDVEWAMVDLPEEYGPPRRLLGEMLRSKIHLLNRAGYLKRDPERITRKDLIELGSELRYMAEMSIEEERGPLYRAISIQSQALTLFHMLELLETQGTHALRAFLERIERSGKRSHKALMGEADRLGALLEAASKASNPKVSALTEIVGDQIARNPGSRILVFTQYRDTAKYLVETMNAIPGVRAERFVGQATKPGDRGLTQERQALLIEGLRDGAINVLCATSIAEEGLDIPEVDLVVFYEPIPSEIRYIQRRGRTGRKSPGRVVIIAANQTNDIIYRCASERRVKKMAAIAETLNRTLQPKLKPRARPAPNPLSGEELEDLWRRVGPQPTPTPMATEGERLRGFTRIVESAMRDLYLKVLESGEEATPGALCRAMEEEGYSRDVTEAALRKLVKRRYLTEMPEKVGIPMRPIPGTRIFTVEVEKILPGVALVCVDGKYAAKLTPENYEGPRKLLKKNSAFKAQGSLYQLNGDLYVNIRQVIQVL